MSLTIKSIQKIQSDLKTLAEKVQNGIEQKNIALKNAVTEQRIETLESQIDVLENFLESITESINILSDYE